MKQLESCTTVPVSELGEERAGNSYCWPLTLSLICRLRPQPMLPSLSHTQNVGNDRYCTKLQILILWLFTGNVIRSSLGWHTRTTELALRTEESSMRYWNGDLKLMTLQRLTLPHGSKHTNMDKDTYQNHNNLKFFMNFSKYYACINLIRMRATSEIRYTVDRSCTWRLRLCICAYS